MSELTSLAGQFINKTYQFERYVLSWFLTFLQNRAYNFESYSFGALSIQNDAFNLQTGLSGLPVVANGRRSQSPGMLLLAHQKEDGVHQFES